MNHVQTETRETGHDVAATLLEAIGGIRYGSVEIVIHEGRKRQVRRMCEAVGHPVRSLVRTRIGPLHDARLGPGEWRPLSLHEVRALYSAAQPGAGTERTKPQQ